MQIIKIVLLLFFVNGLFAEQIDYYIKDGSKIHLYKVNNSLRDVKDNSLTLYEKSDGKYIGLKDTFFVKIKDGVYIQSLLKKYNLKLVKQYSKNNFLLKSIDTNILDIINDLNLDKDTVYAYPNFYTKVKPR